MDIVKVIQVGNSLAVVIPAAYRRRAGLKLGDQVYFELCEDQSIVIRGLVHAIETKRKESIKGAGDLSAVIRRNRLPRD